MAVQQDATAGDGRVGLGDTVVRTTSAAGAAIAQLVSGLGTAFLALLVLLWLAVTAVTSPVGVGLFMAPAVLSALHALAGRERARLGRRGPEVIAPEPPPTRLRLALVDPTTRRELRWLARHATLGFLLGLLGVLLPVIAARDSLFPLYWKLFPEDTTATSVGLGHAHSWPQALAVVMLGVGWTAIILGLGPGMARSQARPGRLLLAAGPETDLSLRVAELTATRAAALDAHATELRRIERSLHDGTQNRIVSVTVLLGAARRMMARDPAGADELLERAQSAAEQALAELRTVSRSILPPVLDDRGLAGALGARRELRGALPDRRGGTRTVCRLRRGDRLLHRGRGSDQHRQTQRRRKRHRHRAQSRRAPPPVRRGRRPGRRGRGRRLRAHRHPPPDRGARRHSLPGQPARRPDNPEGGPSLWIVTYGS